MHENILSFWKFFDGFHSFASELNRAADVIVLSETWFSVNTCHDVQGYTGFHTYRADKTELEIVFISNGSISLCLLEIVTHPPIWPNFQCVMHIMR